MRPEQPEPRVYMGLHAAFKDVLPKHKATGTYLAHLQNCVTWLLVSSSLSVRLHGITLLPLDGLLWNLIFEDFLEICWEYSSFINIRQKELHTFTILSHWILLKTWNFSEKSCKENQNTYFTFINSSSENYAIYTIQWKNMVHPDRLQMTI